MRLSPVQKAALRLIEAEHGVGEFKPAYSPLRGTRGPIRVPGDRAKESEDFEALLAFQVKAYGLPNPVLQLHFAKALRREWRFDLAWPDLMIAAEVEGAIYSGGRHVRGAGYEEDLVKYNTAASLSWTVYRFSTGMVERGEAVAVLEKALRPTA